MNSTSLYQQFPEAYEHFFSDKPIVISMPFCINRCGDLSDSYTGVNIKQKIPLRIYASIKPGANEGYRLKDFHFYSLSTQKFELDKAYDYIPYAESLVRYFNDCVKDFPIEDCGYEISFFSELPKGVGIGFDQIILSIVTSLVYRATKGYSDRYRYERRDKSLLDRLVDPLEAQLLQTIVELEKIIFGYSYRSGYAITSFFDGSYPFTMIQSQHRSKSEGTNLPSIFVSQINKGPSEKLTNRLNTGK